MELEILRTIQAAANPALDIFFQAVTMLGEPAVLLLIFTILYWAADKERGERLAYALAVSLPVCNILKELIKAPRPIGEAGVRSLRTQTATGYSFPSGHSQNAATAYGLLALTARRPAWRRVCGALMLLVGFSRLYLGVHYPKDVLAGLALGLLCAWGTETLWQRVKNRETLYLLSAMLLLPFLFFFGGHDLYAAEGCLAGFALAVPFEGRFVRFTTEISRPVKAGRWLGGALLLGGMAWLLKRLLPGEEPFILLRYALLVFTGMGLYPWLFTACEKKWGKGRAAK